MKHFWHFLIVFLLVLGAEAKAASVLFAGTNLAPCAAGLYQIAIQGPARLADGDWPIQASIGGVQSPAGTVLTVRHQRSQP
jgi:uncharacterized protein (TIGR03437 family)